MGTNVDRLREAGFLKGETLPEPYHAVVEGLSDEEIETLVNVKRRLDEEREFARRSDPDVPDYVDHLVPL